MINLASLEAPFQLGARMLRNRVAMAPMTRQHSPDGIPGPEVAAYYARRAAGGVGLILTEGVTLDRPASTPYRGVPNIWAPEACAGWRAVVRNVHANDAAICCQLWHAGPLRVAADSPFPDVPTESASGLDKPGSVAGRSLSDEDIQDIVESYARGAKAAQDAGFDAVEVHCAHGYLLDTFLWAGSNQRDDRWGGLHAEDRAAFPVEVVKAVRLAVGPGYPVLARFSQWKQQDFGARLWTTPHDLATTLGLFVDAGVDLIDCSTRRYWEPEFQGSPLSFAGWARNLTGKPTMAVGSVGLQHDFMSAFLREGSPRARLEELVRRMQASEFDLIAVGRALLADPDWWAKVRDGEWEKIQDVPERAIDNYY